MTVHERVIAGVSAAAAAIGLAPHGMTPSPITGATGNQEYLLHLRAGTAPATRRCHGAVHVITAVGIVAKRGLAAAAPHLVRLIDWLAGRGLPAVVDTDTAALIGSVDGVRVVSRDDLPGLVDLVVVLGGDGTLLGIADRVGRSGTPRRRSSASTSAGLDS